MKSHSKIKTLGLQTLTAGCLLLNALPGQAQVSGDDGVGEVLLFSFFSTQQGWDSYLNISHQPGDSGAFRVLIREGYDGEKVISFNVYNSSTWRASLSAKGDGSVLRVAEGGCLVTGSTQMEGAGAELIFLPVSMGMVEVYALPTPPETVGESCDHIGAWSREGRWLSGVAQQTLIPPYAELSGEMMLVNVSKGLATEYPAIAFREFMHNPVHAKPQVDKPDLSSAKEGMDHLYQLLKSTDMLANDVTLDASINAQTDWIISYPLTGYQEPSSWGEVMINGELRQCDTFSFPARPGGASLSVSLSDLSNFVALWQMDEVPALSHQEGLLDFIADVTPLPPPIQVEPALCYGLNVVSFGDQGAMIIDEDDVRHYTIASNELIEGVSYVRWDQAVNSRAAVAYKLTSFQNGTLQGGSVLANYAIMKRHVEH